MPWHKRTFDIVVSSIAIVLALPLMAIIALAVKLTSRGPALHWSRRVGHQNRVFSMPKFRSMQTDAPQITTHLFVDPSRFLTPIGGFLRYWSMDELPQLFSILMGDLSLVGPRPALFNQYDLAALRTGRNLHLLVPGLTGWAQVNGRNDLSVTEKVQFDAEYARRRSFGFDLRILFCTIPLVITGKGASHLHGFGAGSPNAARPIRGSTRAEKHLSSF
ncbi:MAG TPA: sugar transferase [Terracidiphilus sp.]|jgi:O-antigen biosynthesis protein WbqP